MSLKFEEKSITSRIECKEIDSLEEFLIKNSNYFYLAFKILSKKINPIEKEQMDKFIERSKEISLLKDDDLQKLNKFKDVISDFYNCSLSDLSDRRGRLLEKIISNNCPIKNIKEYKKYEEAIIFYNDKKLSEKDLDIVFVADEIELHECKAGLKNVLRTPICENQRNEEKLKLMCSTKKYAEKDGTKCDIYLATYIFDITNKYKRILEQEGFGEIKIFNGQEIIEYIK